METTITCKRCKECGALIAPTSILCPECEKRLMRKPKEENIPFYTRVTRRPDGTVVVDDSFFRAFVRENLGDQLVAARGEPSVRAAEPRAEYVNIDATTVYDWS